MAGLPDAWLRVMNVLLDSAVAWRSPAEVADALGRGVEETTDLLCDLDVAGWVNVWEDGSGPVVSLSALAAERLRARLVESGRDETPRWARAGDPEPPAPRARNVMADARAASLEYLVDPADSPDVASERGERTEALARSLPQALPRPGRRDEPPRPTVLVGLNLTPWPGPGEPAESVCPACGGQTLRSHMYCLCCDRWGLDSPSLDDAPAPAAALTPAPRPARAQAEPQRTAADNKAEAETLRARRKARRRRRQAARLEAERQRKLSPRAPQAPVADSPRNAVRPALVPLHSPPPGMNPASARASR